MLDILCPMHTLMVYPRVIFGDMTVIWCMNATKARILRRPTPLVPASSKLPRWCESTRSMREMYSSVCNHGREMGGAVKH